ncbi:ribonuclease III [uncultured Bacteroides sp.]|uniref:ribonuclease III n=1 Tax=uncultured Bacteroides sp. TaxID=162156 RepID=UPI00280B17DD|nr:ribonuclease III [uncultured Bacteroides sp.]
MFSNILDEIRLLFRKDKESYLCFYKMLGFYPRNIEIYQQALLHKSSSVKAKGRLLNNERLEFLGDAILDAVVADIVYKRFEGKREGFLTNTRSKIVQRETLNRIAVQIGLDKLIKYTTRQSSHNSYMCGNAFEALVGAIYLDRGYETCKFFMEERIIKPYLNLDKLSRKEVNFKSKLIEWGQKNRFLIEFNLLEQSVDEDQNPVFETQVVVEQTPAGQGKGYSKKESQQEAAHETLNKIKNDPQFIDAIFAEKAAREKTAEEAQNVVASDTSESAQTPLAPMQEAAHEVSSLEVTEEAVTTEKYDDVERIIAEAEEAAFQLTEAETTETETPETETTAKAL